MNAEDWIKRAETDLRVAKKLLDAKEETWVIAYHAEQAIEKFLKAFLVYRDIRFRKTHNIKELLDLCVKTDKEFEELSKLDVEYLTVYATEVRYPGFYEPAEEEVIEAIETAEKVREFILKKLGL